MGAFSSTRPCGAGRALLPLPLLFTSAARLERWCLRDATLPSGRIGVDTKASGGCSCESSVGSQGTSGGALALLLVQEGCDDEAAVLYRFGGTLGPQIPQTLKDARALVALLSAKEKTDDAEELVRLFQL